MANAIQIAGPRTQDMADVCEAITGSTGSWVGFDSGSPEGDFSSYERLTVADICRWFGVPIRLVAMPERLDSALIDPPHFLNGAN